MVDIRRAIIRIQQAINGLEKTLSHLKNGYIKSSESFVNSEGVWQNKDTTGSWIENVEEEISDYKLALSALEEKQEKEKHREFLRKDFHIPKYTNKHAEVDRVDAIVNAQIMLNNSIFK